MSDPTFTPNTEKRIEDIETSISDCWRLVKSLASSNQINRLSVLIKKQKQLLEEEITTIEKAIENLEKRFDGLT